jgi:DNA-binding phage protein
MATRSYNETVRQDLQHDAEFRRALLGEVLGSMAAGDVETGTSVLRTYIEGTIGYRDLGAAVGQTAEALKSSLSPSGNPNVREFFEIVAYLQKIDSTVLEVHGVQAIAA